MVTCAKVLANWVGYIIVMSVSEHHITVSCMELCLYVKGFIQDILVGGG